MDKLKALFKDNWKSIILSYFLFAVNSILSISYPKLLGNTIDHLMSKDYFYIWYLILTFAVMMLFGYIGRIYDIQVFSRIHRKFASTETQKQLEKGVESTKINGRINMLGNVVRFFEVDVVTVLNTTFGAVGSLYFLTLVSWKLSGLLLLTGAALAGLSYNYSPKAAELTKAGNDLSEDQSDVVSSRKISLINNLLRASQKLSIRRAKLDAGFSLSIQGIVYGSVTALLTYYVMFNKVTIGSVFSTYRYMFDFCNSLIGVPFIVTSYLQIKDVIKRLEE